MVVYDQNRLEFYDPIYSVFKGTVESGINSVEYDSNKNEVIVLMDGMVGFINTSTSDYFMK